MDVPEVPKLPEVTELGLLKVKEELEVKVKEELEVKVKEELEVPQVRDQPVKRIKPPVLRLHEEKEILSYLLERASKGEPVSREEVIEKVVKFIKSDNRKNPFRDGTPGDKWFSLFRRRHNSHFMKLEKEQQRIVEKIGFTEKVMNTVTYKAKEVKKPIPDTASASTRKRRRRRKPKKFGGSSTEASRVNTPVMNQSTSEAIFTAPTSDEGSNINTDDGEKSQEDQSDPMDFQAGSKLEVMDFNDDKWYPVKVVEVDYDEGEVLVHFEKWSNLYDEWVRMDSNRIRRPRLPSSNTSKKVFVENEKVIAVWAYNHKYPATIRKVLPNDKYEVLFHDGYAKILRGCKLYKATEEDLRNIKLPPPKKPAPPMGADPLDPDLGPKEERRLKKRRMDVYEALRPQKKQRPDTPETVDIKKEPRSTSPSPTPPPSKTKPRETFRVVLRGRGQPRGQSDSEDEDDGWDEDNDDSDQGTSARSEKKKKLKKKKKGSFGASDQYHTRHSKLGTEEDSERWNMEIPKGVTPVQIKDTEGYYRESIIIPDKKLPSGWIKHTMRRKTGAKWDVFLVNPDGHRFRSRNELRNHFADLKIPFPEDRFDFMVGRKMEMIRSQTEGRKKLPDSPGSAAKASPVHKKSEKKKADTKGESTPEHRRVKTLLPKGRNVDSGDEVKREQSPKTPKSSSEATTPGPAFPIAELRTPDGGYTCCGKSFRKENLFQMHMKHYHPEYSNLFGSTPNVADLAYARTVGEPLEDSRAEAMTPRNSLLERVSRYEADRQRKGAEPAGDIALANKVKLEKDSAPEMKTEVEEAQKSLQIEEKKDLAVSEKKLKEETVEEEERKEEKKVLEKAAPKEVQEEEPKPATEVTTPAPTEEKTPEPEEKIEEPSTSTKDVKEPKVEKCPPPAAPPPQPAPPPPVPHSIPVIKPVIKPVISKVTISSDKDGKPTIKTLLPLRPPAPPVPVTPTPTTSSSTSEPTVAAEPQKLKDVKIKEDVDEEAPSIQNSKSRPRKRTVSEPVLKKPKLSKAATGSLEEDAVVAPEPSPSTSGGTGSSSGYRFSRNRSQVPRVALEKISVTQDSNGRVLVSPVVEKSDKTHNSEGRRPFKKFKSANNISKKAKGATSGEDPATKVEGADETLAAADEADVYENLRKEEIINCTCGFTEEDGLMIQCDLCLCWQHGYCNNINKESEVPEKYVCHICLHPARQRESMRYRHCQDWLKEGKLPSFSFTQRDPEKTIQREKILKKSHELAASVLQLETVVHSLNVKTHIATMKQDHPKLYLWAKSWKDGSSEAKNESEEDKREGAGPQPEAAIDSKECRLKLLEHIEDYQTRVEDRLTSIDAHISALEAEDPELASDQVSDSRMKQTVQMLLRDLTTLQRVASLNS